MSWSTLLSVRCFISGNVHMLVGQNVSFWQYQRCFHSCSINTDSDIVSTLNCNIDFWSNTIWIAILDFEMQIRVKLWILIKTWTKVGQSEPQAEHEPHSSPDTHQSTVLCVPGFQIRVIISLCMLELSQVNHRSKTHYSQTQLTNTILSGHIPQQHTMHV